MSSFWSEIRADFPITERCIYLDHASGGPIPRPVYEKLPQYHTEHFKEADFAWPRWMERKEEVRRKAAEFINADPSEITFTTSTSQGINLIADMIAGSGKVLTNTSEFPSSTLPWLWRKTKLVWQKAEHGRISLKTLQKKLMPDIKTIVTSWVQYGTGFRQDLEALGKIKGNRFLAVNATQGFGAMKVDVKKWNCDFLCTNSYKWMMAGYGGGILYVRKKWLEKFKPAFVSWRSMEEPDIMDNRKIKVRKDAARYEIGCPTFPMIFAVGAALDYFSQIGPEKIEKRVLELSGFAVQGLKKAGFEVLTPEEPENRAGIVIFKSKNPEKLRSRLLAEKIYLSVRGGALRIAPHFYNSFEDLETFIKKAVTHR